MKRQLIRIVSLAVLASAGLGSFALAVSQAGAAAHRRTAGLSPAVAAAAPARIGLRSTSLGSVLVNGRGFTLYAFSRDGKGKDRCVDNSQCPGVWPAATTSGRPRAGRGVKASLLGSIKLPDGRHQVTYAGHPLYTYSGDVAPAQTDYVGAVQFGGTWRAVRASGRPVG